MRVEITAVTQRYDLQEGGFTQRMTLRLPNGDELTLDVADPDDLARVLAAGPLADDRVDPGSTPSEHVREFDSGFMPHSAEVEPGPAMRATAPICIGEVDDDTEMPV